MRKTGRLVITLVTVVALVLPVAADKASSLYEKGKDAEARQEYEAAFEAYLQAWQLKPKQMHYRSAAARTRFEAAAAHVHTGQKLRDAGKFEEALAEFQRAAAIDPSSFIAEQEIRRTRTMMDAAKSAGTGESAPRSMAFRKQLEAAAGPIELQAISNAPITLKLTEDSKVIYETIGKLAGINVLFDPDYTSRRIHIELQGVTLREALELVALESKTFWRAVTPNTIFIAADTPAKRKELEQNLIKTFYMSNLSQPTELQDVVNTLRTILEVSRLTQVPSQGAIVVRGTPDQLALADWLINNLDKSRPEVIVDVAVMVVNRERIRDLGINPPGNASIALQSNVNTTSTSSTSTTSSGTTTTTSTGQINLNTIGNLTAKNFIVSIPAAGGTAATISFLMSDSRTKLLQNPQVRALDGQKASLKIGQRVPVATGSFGAGVGGVGVANTLVNTQFQYLDVGVNIEITPKIHPDREISLKLTMDVSDVDSYTSIGGINQPVIGQRKIEHEVRLKDGEASLLGGILEDQDVKNINGYPWLSNIPLLKYLFSSEHTDKTENELVFVMVPHIVRGQELSSLNLKPLDVGTANAIQLRQLSITPPTKPAAEATPAPATGRPISGGPAPIPGPGASVMAPARVSAAGSAQPQKVMLSFNPSSVNTSVGQTFMMDVMVSGAQNLFSVPLQIQYDPTKLQVVNVSSGSFLGQGEQPVALAQRNDSASGTMQVTANRPPNSGGVSGQGSVLTVTFIAKDSGQATVAITRAGLHDASNQSLEAAGTQAQVNIKNR
jgi:general secretion pathway protein D